MTRLNDGTKKAAGYIYSYDNTPAYQNTLDSVYGRYSAAKAAAYRSCMQLVEKLGGWGVKIPSANNFSFTFAFLFSDSETGEIKLAYITSCNDYVMSYV